MIPYEIGITGHGINCSPNKSCDKVTDEGANDTKHSDFEITEKKKSIKHWIPARQESVARFIIASKIRSAKQISKFVFNVFKLVYSQIERFHKNAKFLSKY